MSGIYLHIPFCKSRCAYCGFFSTTGKTPHTEKAYINAVCKELRVREKYLPSSEYIKTIYFGGGTPSLLSAESFYALMQTIKDIYGERLMLQEFTVECNPDDVTPELATTLIQLGVNRISMGVQSFNPQILSFLHRRHSAQQVVRAIDTFRHAGIDNISIDLIYGIHGQTMDLWQDDIRQAIALSVPHISSYALSYEEGTPLKRLLDGGEITQKSDEEYLQMYLSLVDSLSNAGFEHYEISNFSLPGYRSMHNSSYWNGAPYLGVGAGAHSYKGMTASPSGFGNTSRQWNVSDLQQYISAYSTPHPSSLIHPPSSYVAISSQLPSPLGEPEGASLPWVFENLSAHEQYNDIIVTQLRRAEGIDLSCLPAKYRTHLLHAAQRSLDNGTLALSSPAPQNSHYLHLTRKGLFISDTIMTELII